MNLKTLARFIPPIRRLHDHRNALLAQVGALEARAMAARALVQEELARIEARLLSLEDATQSSTRSAVAALSEQLDGLKAAVASQCARIDDLARQGAERGFLARHAKRQINAILRRVARPGLRIKVLFIVHFAPNWSALEPVWAAMCASEDFDPVVCVVDFLLAGEDIQLQDCLSEHLDARGVPHLRWGGRQPDGFEQSDVEFLLEHLDPDIVFRQTHWDGSVPGGLRTPISAAYRICYLPYHLEVADVPEAQDNQELHHAAWRIFCFSELHQKTMQIRSRLGARNAVVAGHPRLDAIAAACRDAAPWPGEASARPYRILWAPHHSVGPDWLRFGTFPEHWRAVVDFTRGEPGVEVMLRGHHLLFQSLRNLGRMSADEIEAFHAEWASLPNASVDTDPSYVGSFAWSDALLTDGVSFLAEYQATEKPLLFIERDGHNPFTPIGDMAAEGCYRVVDAPAALDRLRSLRDGGEDPLRPVRARNAAAFRPHGGGAALRILDAIRAGLAEETGWRPGSAPS